MTDELLARVAAELEIRNVISRIAILADQGDLDEYVDQFTEDSVWELLTETRHGRADIRAGADARRTENTTGSGSATRHVVTTVAVQIESPVRAVADSYFMFVQNTTTSPTILNMGVYHDMFECEDRVWRLARREITFG